MKYPVIILNLFISVSLFGQKIDYNNFDKKLFEKILFEVLNERREAKCVETLVWSKVLYKEVSVHNMDIITKTNRLHHPDYSAAWDSLRVRQLLANESDKVIGGKTFISIITGALITYYENALRTVKTDMTYRQLAEHSINLWETSYFHNATQYASFLNKDKPGMASCTIGFVKGTNDLYVIFNFVELNRK